MSEKKTKKVSSNIECFNEVTNEVLRSIAVSLNEKKSSLKNASKELDMSAYRKLVDIVSNCIYGGVISNLDYATFLELRNNSIIKIMELVNIPDSQIDDVTMNLDKYRSDINNSHNVYKREEAINKINDVLSTVKAFANRFDSIKKNEESVYNAQIDECNVIIDIIEGKRNSVITQEELDEFINFLKNNSFDFNQRAEFIECCAKLNLQVTLFNSLQKTIKDCSSYLKRLESDYLSDVVYLNAVQEYIMNNVINLASLDLIASEIGISRHLDIPVVKNTLIAYIGRDLLVKANAGSVESLEMLQHLLENEVVDLNNTIRKAQDIINHYITPQGVPDTDFDIDITYEELIIKGYSYEEAKAIKTNILIIYLKDLLEKIKTLDKNDEEYKEVGSLMDSFVSHIEGEQRRAI